MEPRRLTAAQAHLPWWALALPVAAFTALFLLLFTPGEARASGRAPAVERIIEHLQQTLARG
ncbi:hypothetical protein I3F58_23680 [Streptomyces sp. MUM 203J]|nr:hypothetical protein [Streptomyces sp. MUM 203J]